jgi:Cysteine-rich CWC
MTNAVDPSLCPVCGEPNTCGMSQGKTECWCFSVKIPEAALAAVSPEAKNVACICPRCAAAQASAPAG